MERSIPVRIGIIGIAGRMGRELVALATSDPSVTVAGGTVRPTSRHPGPSHHSEAPLCHPRSADEQSEGSPGEAVNQPLAIDGVPVYTGLTDLLPLVDVLIDFSTPESSVATARHAAKTGIPIVIGTTGLTPEQLDVLREASSRIPVYYARNTAHGVNALQQILPIVARALAGYDIEIVEMHHRHKKDAPSGTALALAEAITAGLETSGPRHIYIYGREGYAPRQTGEIGFHSIRGGGNTGEHTIIFASDQEEIRISHRALSRGAFAAGAIRAAIDLVGKAPSWYGPTE
ncbi:MAG: 4-hydroxy-tetrahydrodipicolinate reductase [Thermomicrobiales bacterium]